MPQAKRKSQAIASDSVADHLHEVGGASPAADNAPKPDLNKDFKSWAQDTAEEMAQAGRSILAQRTLPSKSTIAKSAAALFVLLAFGWSPLQRLLATTSAEATVNARVITVRAPIDGDVSSGLSQLEVGTSLTTGENILTVSNRRADQSHLNNLRRAEKQLVTTISALQDKQRVLELHHADLAKQQERFRLGRIEQLERRISETDADIKSATTQKTVSANAFTRARSLKSTGFLSQANFDKAMQDERMASERLNALTERRAGMLVELTAARDGTFVGDSYNDTPQSAQRALDVGLQLADISSRLSGAKVELEDIRVDLRNEEKRFQQLSEAIIQSSVSGRIWEILTAPGEHVNAGQDLLRVLDCSSAIVTASVSETAYQRLSIGQRATFKPRGGGDVAEGWIVALNGMASVASNTAIRPSTLSREPYHVTLKFPALASGSDCHIGRSGIVNFDTKTRVLDQTVASASR